jgi:predicted Fe-Mo cluster-binding NifX family protein
MKILLATDGETLESKIAKRFGHANYYLIFDNESKEIEARVNHGHDDNHSSLGDLANEGVTDFIVGNIGPNAFKVLQDKSTKVYLARKNKAKDALEKFLNNELEELTTPTLKRSIEGH